MKIKNSERLKRIKKIENTNYLANIEVKEAIQYIKTAYGYKDIVQAQEVYKNWRNEYLNDRGRY